MGTKDGKHSNSEGSALFRGAVRDAQPLKTRGRLAPHDAPKSKPGRKKRLHQREQPASQEDVTSVNTKTPASDLCDNMLFQRNNITHKTMRELRRGKHRIQEEIDLHGCTRAEARIILEDFIDECIDHGLSCIRIIHGKGMRSGPEGPVLKLAVGHWLQGWDTVVAFCPARPNDGGTGAIYVLLSNFKPG
ncbi:MAG: DNA mismatch repair protein MutS [Gammaproteobacteria bacterium]|nr:DNA mismatch repair protein MutS [Gammaproteobacteria bacterium]MCP4088820.1 DNA mismatch repair protein MutS [Gammaproteobacteria bacterium]